MSGDSEPAERKAGASASSLLDRPLPPGYREDWARHFADTAAVSNRVADSASADQTVVIFRIGAEWLALSTALFHEIAEPRRIHSLPHRRDDMLLGIVNVRGELLVCVSLAALLGIGDGPSSQRSDRIKTFARIVVIGREGRRLAFPVDEVHGIHRYAEADLTATPATIGKAAARFATAMISWQGRSVGRLDDQLVLDTLDRSIA
ncbi:chemotaxis protein CheW [Mesorhizobium sp. BR1-1-16]|uniref:chemotaxis protein CheW n=1 Tax=Mesorhizobium sp. BR1-1-16 TaxID=2876653 RepID=UPI001CCED7FB|nr:chemotaxis protein CheW [Mesorhizobium sp. BR1-1-16]MBZ9935260.1 chemotaxis protein CheW [Mesorhizobium sp. BR1-1-16]